ncbi:MAG TPA: hypothetical protein VFE18_19960 [Phenylobacterium sp.]|jgi:hypothetical protein|uniref:hypothetical protein n=1 Tax=Phenylobacterium sp. TaxID=1871053 RepID=UPI002D29E892|nr:hypothetical protein [Phenylobacterium sp.]HZZ70452.1 hypothetical protein [Phenylobacterium sp.]
MRIGLALMGAVATLVAATSGLAAQKASAAEKCFDVSEVKGHTIADDHTLYLKVGGASIYRLGMSNNCLGGMGPGDPVTVKARSASKICEAADLDVHAEVNGGGLSSRCILDTLTKLTPAQASAIPAKLKP